MSSFFQLTPRGDAKDTYTWESQHRTLLIACAAVVAVLIVLTPVVYFTLRALKARRAAKNGTGTVKTKPLFVGRLPSMRKAKDIDSDDDWDFPPCADPPRAIAADAEKGTVRQQTVAHHRNQDSMHAIDLNTPVIARFQPKEQSTPKGVWEAIAAKTKRKSKSLW